MREDVYCGSMLKIYFIYLELISASYEPSGDACMHIWRLARELHTPLIADGCRPKGVNIRRYESKEKYYHINGFT